MKMKSQDNDRLVAAMREVYEQVYAAVGSFEEGDRVGPDLAYLLGAMLKGTRCQWPADRPLLNILRPLFAPGHAVWVHIDIDRERP
jgi:hypothetical protein